VMGKKKLAALAVILISALVLTVYALRVSNVLEVYWSVYEPQTNLVLSFVEGHSPPSSIPRGSWRDVWIRLRERGAGHL